MVQNVWFYSLVGLGAGILVSVANRWLRERYTRDMRPFASGSEEPRPQRQADHEIERPSAGITDWLRTLTWRDLPLVVLTAAGMVILWLRYGPSVRLVIISAYFCVFVLIFVLDIAYRWVPNLLLFPTAIFALAASLLTGHPSLGAALLGGTVGFLGFYLVAIAYRGAMGAGDVKLAGVIGLMTGFPDVLTALTIGVVMGGIIAGLLLISGKTTRKAYIPYAPFLVSGALVTLIFGKQAVAQFVRLSGW
jgi:leader peptidase (prepilin peptidase)/N-methyltransferase